MANEIKIIKLDDNSLKAIHSLAVSLDRFRREISPFLDILENTPHWEVVEFDGEIEADVKGETYVHHT